MKHSAIYFIITLILGSVCYVFYMHRNDTPIYETDDPIIDTVLSKEYPDSAILNDSTLQIEKNNRTNSKASAKQKEFMSIASTFYINYQKNSEQNKENLSSNSESSQKQKQQTKTRKNNTKITYTGQCQATTQKGRQCSRKAKPGRRYCWQHE